MISVALVILVVFIFLRNGRATLIPSVAVPVSLIGTFGVMFLLGFSIDNLSLMALTISTGFVVDDAIVVMENISRHLEKGMKPFEAALLGAREIGFTVFSISVSLIAVFIPILMMGGIVGRLFREFAITLSTAIVVSMVISLTTTPAMCAYLLREEKEEHHGRLYRSSEKFFAWMLETYRRSLVWALDNSALMLVILLFTIALNVVLIYKIPKGFFPQQDTGAVVGGVQGPQDSSFPAMDYSIRQLVGVIKSDPAVANVNAYTGGNGSSNTGFIYVALKPLNERKIGAPDIINRLRPKLNRLPVASALPAGIAGPANWRQVEQCALPIHHSVRQCSGSIEVGADPVERNEKASGPAGCQLGSAKRGIRGTADLRSRQCGEPWTHCAGFGFLAVCGIRSVRSFDYLHPTEPILRCTRGRPAVLANSQKV